MENIGIVLIPVIFGLTRGMENRRRWFEKAWFKCKVVDIYAGQPFKQPHWMSIVGGKDEGVKLDQLFERFDETILMSKIAQAVLLLREAGCKKVFLVGNGFGGIYALRMAEVSGLVSGAVAFYPHLAFPASVTKEAPNLLETKCPTLLIYGLNDQKVGEETLRLAQALPFGQVRWVDGGHAFVDPFVQGWWPSPLWRPRLSRMTWRITRRWIAKQAQA